MPSRLRRPVALPVALPGALLGLLLGLLVSAGLGVPSAPAEAAAVPRVSGLTAAGQDWAHARLRLRWTAVSGATYQVRWATSTTRLA
ncbi:MAG TPA: hypothetical protein VNS46_13020, partial [Nocardioides sp.]|nr:hypothetical protein [Nocardioides sp.]